MGDDIPGLVPTVYLENNSEHGIVPCWNYQATYYIPDMIVFSDTLLPTQYYDPPRDALPVEEGGPDSVAMNNPLLFILEPSEKSYVECFEGDDPLRELFSYLPHDTLSVFVLHADTVRKYSWDEIRNSYNIVVAEQNAARRARVVSHPDARDFGHAGARDALRVQGRVEIVGTRHVGHAPCVGEERARRV